MTKVLFVKANNRGVDHAVSVMLYQAFLDSYKESHPDDKIVELDLFEQNMPYLDADMINGHFKEANGIPLTGAEQQAVEVARKYLDQFLIVDKVIFAFPMWNMTIPAVLHTYLDYLNQAGKTFKYTAEGPVGLITNKRVALLHARGGVYSESSMAATEMAFSYVRNVLSFFGVTHFVNVIVEGHHQYRDQAEALITEGIAKAKTVAASF